MTKIWEVDFTSFSGSSNVLYDLVGSGHLTSYSGTMNKQEPLIGFDNRRGIYISLNNNAQTYYLYGTGVPTISLARFSASYNYRSFVLWIRPVGLNSGTSYWDYATGERDNIWGGINVSDAIVGIGSAGAELALYNYSATALISTGSTVTNDAWHSLIVTVDRITPQIKMYLDSVLIGTSSKVLSSTTPVSEQIGDNSDVLHEGSYYLGQATTYDHILTSGEISAIHNSYMVDSQTGPAYYQTFSGYVFNVLNQPVSGTEVRAFYLDTDQVVHKTTTSGDGYFEMILPYSGTYLIISEDAPYGGTRSIPVIATSGSVYFT